MNRSVVHEDYYVFVLSFLVDSKLLKYAVKEVVEHYCVRSTLSNLRCYNSVLSHCRYHRERIPSQLLCTLLPLNPSHL